MYDENEGMTMRQRRAHGVGRGLEDVRALDEIRVRAIDRILRVSFWATDALGACAERASAAVRPPALETIGPFGRDRRVTRR